MTDQPTRERPVAFRILRKDGAWELSLDEEAAQHTADALGTRYEGLYNRGGRL